MSPHIKDFLEKFKETGRKRSHGFRLTVFLAAGAVTGLACVLFMWAFDFVLKYQLNPARIGMWCWITAPVLFLISVELIRRTAPFADGAGIPQTVFAASHLNETSIRQIHPLVSFKTMAIKVIALLIGLWAGASTGREGPTVHVAACLFLGIILAVRHLTGVKLDPRSAIVAGAAAGLAAAFNTPLAGVTFAIEELSSDQFSNIKEYVLMAIILAGIAAQSLIGDYEYFGRLADPAPVAGGTVFLIGVAGGLGGAFFSTVLIKGRALVAAVTNGFWRYAIPALFAVGLFAVNAVSPLNVLGPGNTVAQSFVTGSMTQPAFSFPLLKMIATLLTYWSGIAGGIFAPCLSMGAGIGFNIASLTGGPVAACALIGMAAFLTGTIQAPITAFVIIFEMTGHHQMLLPIMLASLIAVITAKACGAQHLYQTLAESYGKAVGYNVKLSQ